MNSWWRLEFDGIEELNNVDRVEIEEWDDTGEEAWLWVSFEIK